MSHLKKETMVKCFTLLNEFIDESLGLTCKKGTARLALEQLKKITAGTKPDENLPTSPDGDASANLCVGRPRADLDPAIGI